MRVLFYLGDKQWSGSTRLALAAARGLGARGHQITIACCAGSRLAREAAVVEIDTIEISDAATAVGGAFDLRRVLAERFIEVAIVERERDHLIVASAMRFAERGGVLRRVSATAGLDLQRGGRLALKMAAAGIIVSSERELKELSSPLWSIPGTVAPLGIDVSSYDAVEPATRGQMGVPGNGVIIACAYDPSGRHRMSSVFRTLALLAPRHVNIHAVVFGPGSTDDELRMHAAALGVGPVVSFLGERDDARNLMRAAQAGWVVASQDAGALACLDFMALRVPVIAERSSLMQQFVADGITGLLLSPGEPSHTASGVAAFLTREDRRVAMGNAGRTRVQRDFLESTMLDGFERAVNAAGDRTKWAVR